ncbi:aspartate/glutamate racemase family protein [Candidatus Woesearchaeota archaeon]|nr:aspartate/glutamate racemase family protein [Candidatus Woesearchaeota archaeon]
MNKKIGILGGIGPEATGCFYLKLIKRLQETGKVKKNTDYPQIIINSIPAPDLVGDKKDDLKAYKKGLKELDSFGIDFIVIVCNTIQLFHEQLSREVKAPIIDLRKEVEANVRKRKRKQVTVISTESTIKEGLFKFEGIKDLQITKNEMAAVQKSILDINMGKKNFIAAEIGKKYIEKGSIIISGCTEISLVIPEDKNIINTTDLLIEAVLRLLNFTHTCKNLKQ